MCCLFGMVDYGGYFPARRKNWVLSKLATACEARGIDATGIAYNKQYSLEIYKRPCEAHKLKFRVPTYAQTIMGHTRMTTQGSEKRIYNNHPFPGSVSSGQFALAHNGVLRNDKTLRRELKLPAAKIETDSYVSVQLIEHQNTLSFDSLKYMAEKVEGSFTFTVMDDRNSLYFVKGDNPMCLYHFKQQGFYLYASTKAILDQALMATRLQRLPHETIEMVAGEILKIDQNGQIIREHFTMRQTYYSTRYFGTYFARDFDYEDELMEYGRMMGVPEQELKVLRDAGYDHFDLEEAIYDEDFRRYCISLCRRYDRMEVPV